MRTLALVALLLLAFGGVVAADGPVAVSATLDRRGITIGDPIQLTLIVEVDAGYQITDNGIARNMGEVEVLDAQKPEVTRQANGRTRFTFKGQKLLFRHSKDEGKEEEGTFKADPKKSPKHLDITIKNKTLHGIYEVKGGELKVCYETGDNRENRPTKFATNKQEELVLIVLKRQKP